MHCPQSWILVLRFFATLRDKGVGGGVKWMRKIRAMDLELKKENRKERPDVVCARAPTTGDSVARHIIYIGTTWDQSWYYGWITIPFAREAVAHVCVCVYIYTHYI